MQSAVTPLCQPSDELVTELDDWTCAKDARMRIGAAEGGSARFSNLATLWFFRDKEKRRMNLQTLPIFLG